MEPAVNLPKPSETMSVLRAKHIINQVIDSVSADRKTFKRVESALEFLCDYALKTEMIPTQPKEDLASTK